MMATNSWFFPRDIKSMSFGPVWEKKIRSVWVKLKKKNCIPYFSDYKTHLPPKFGRKWGMSYSLNVAYLAC